MALAGAVLVLTVYVIWTRIRVHRLDTEVRTLRASLITVAGFVGITIQEDI